MKHIQISRRRVVISLIATVVILLACIIGTFFFMSATHYGGAADISESNGVTASVWVDCHIKHAGVPYVVMWSIDHPPYDLVVVFGDPSNRSSEVLITQLSIIYPSGKTVDLVRPGDKLRETFTEKTVVNSSSGEVVRSKYSMVSHRFPSVIDRAQDFQCIIRAAVILKDGSTLDLHGERVMHYTTESSLKTALSGQ